MADLIRVSNALDHLQAKIAEPRREHYLPERLVLGQLHPGYGKMLERAGGRTILAASPLFAVAFAVFFGGLFAWPILVGSMLLVAFGITGVTWAVRKEDGVLDEIKHSALPAPGEVGYRWIVRDGDEPGTVRAQLQWIGLPSGGHIPTSTVHCEIFKTEDDCEAYLEAASTVVPADGPPQPIWRQIGDGQVTMEINHGGSVDAAGIDRLREMAWMHQTQIEEQREGLSTAEQKLLMAELHEDELELAHDDAYDEPYPGYYRGE